MEALISSIQKGLNNKLAPSQKKRIAERIDTKKLKKQLDEELEASNKRDTDGEEDAWSVPAGIEV